MKFPRCLLAFLITRAECEYRLSLSRLLVFQLGVFTASPNKFISLKLNFIVILPDTPPPTFNYHRARQLMILHLFLVKVETLLAYMKMYDIKKRIK